MSDAPLMTATPDLEALRDELEAARLEQAAADELYEQAADRLQRSQQKFRDLEQHIAEREAAQARAARLEVAAAARAERDQARAALGDAATPLMLTLRTLVSSIATLVAYSNATSDNPIELQNRMISGRRIAVRTAAGELAAILHASGLHDVADGLPAPIDAWPTAPEIPAAENA
jgi:hypothetical protein